jgi:predicted TIM-barrel fold metal-dependent hydrolase
MFYACVAMLPMNNIDGALQILSDQVQVFPEFVGVQLFTRALGKSIADAEFEPIFSFCHQHNIPIWLHPVFDERKPDNNIIFSWEYELSQSMLEIVQSAYFKKYPNLKIIVHHAGAMIPYFAGRINHILPQELADDFKKFYVDTALLGNPKAIELAVDYFGDDHVVFGTDAPLGIAPAGATEEIIKAIDELPILHQGQEAIYHQNILKLIGVEK